MTSNGASSPLLSLKEVNTYYGLIHILQNVSLDVYPGELVCLLGGNASGTRLNRIFKDVIKDPEIEAELRPLLARFTQERNKGERFGDWCDRTVLKEQPAKN